MHSGKARSDIANTALRIFLQEVGVAYDKERGLDPYDGKEHFAEVRAFFGEACCYCGDPLAVGLPAQDHLDPDEQDGARASRPGSRRACLRELGQRKAGQEWHAFLGSRAGVNVAERYAEIDEFVKGYGPSPDHADLKKTADDLYAEVGQIAMTLINVKVKRISESL